MGGLLLLRRTLAAAMLIVVSVAIPEARAEYAEGAFFGTFAGGGGTGSFTLPAGAPFPQVTLGTDYVPGDADNHVVQVRNGLAMNFALSVGEIAATPLSGVMRFTLFQLDTPDGPRISLMGTYTLDIPDEVGTYQISGPVAGDGFTIYLPGKDDNNTPGDTTDDKALLVKIHATGVGAGPDALVGRAQVLIGRRVIATMNETVATATTDPGQGAGLAAPGLLLGTTFNQTVPPDGSADIVLSADTPSGFRSGIARAGTIGSDAYATSAAVLRLLPGGVGGAGIGLNSFTRTLPGGATMEGLMLSDIGPTAAGAAPYEGHVFAFVTGQAAPALYLGTAAGSVSDAGVVTGTTAAELFAVDSAPPEAFAAGDHPDLFADRFTPYETLAWDFNGWQDIATVQLLINDRRVPNRILARYDVRRNRLSLFNRATNRWVGRCAPGTPGTVKTPWVTLDCAATSVTRGGEGVRVLWSLKPGPRMLPVASPNAYVKVTDRAGLVAGWRSVRDGQTILAVGP